MWCGMWYNLGTIMTQKKTAKKTTTKKKKISNKVVEKPKRQLSPRAKVVLKDLSENPRKPVSRAMKDAGYSETYSAKPQEFKATLTVQKEFNDFFPREFIFGQLRKLHNAHTLRDMVFPIGIPDEAIIELLESINLTVKKIAEVRGLKYAWFFAPDNRAMKDALDMSFKIMGEYTGEKNNPANPIRDMSDEELMAEIQQQLKVFKKK